MHSTGWVYSQPDYDHRLDATNNQPGKNKNMSSSMVQSTRTIKVFDSKGFHYEVEVKHSPQHGFSTAYYKDRIIEQVSEYKLTEPTTDIDRDWEAYEEKLLEYMDAAESDLQPLCAAYFDRQ